MGKGFHIEFENGLTISVQFGYGNYCDNYNNKDVLVDGKLSSNTAEIAIWDKNDKWLTRKFIKGINDDVVGHLKADEVFDIMKKVKNWKAKSV